MAGGVAGVFGALLGLGGGVFLVPFLVLVLGVPMRLAVGISLTTVIATSSVVSSGRAGRSLINLRLGMLLEVATTAGGLTGGIVAAMLSTALLQRLFGVVAVLSGARHADAPRAAQRDPRSRASDPGRLGGRYYEDESGAVVTYRVKRVPLGDAGVVRRGQRVVAARRRRRRPQGAGAERVVRRPAARGGGDERVHDRRHGHRRRGDLLRPRRDRPVDGGGGGARRARGLARRASPSPRAPGPSGSSCCSP